MSLRIVDPFIGRLEPQATFLVNGEQVDFYAAVEGKTLDGARLLIPKHSFIKIVLRENSGLNGVDKARIEASDCGFVIGFGRPVTVMLPRGHNVPIVFVCIQLLYKVSRLSEEVRASLPAALRNNEWLVGPLVYVETRHIKTLSLSSDERLLETLVVLSDKNWTHEVLPFARYQYDAPDKLSPLSDKASLLERHCSRAAHAAAATHENDFTTTYVQNMAPSAIRHNTVLLERLVAAAAPKAAAPPVQPAPKRKRASKAPPANAAAPPLNVEALAQATIAAAERKAANLPDVVLQAPPPAKRARVVSAAVAASVAAVAVVAAAPVRVAEVAGRPALRDVIDNNNNNNDADDYLFDIQVVSVARPIEPAAPVEPVEPVAPIEPAPLVEPAPPAEPNDPVVVPDNGDGGGADGEGADEIDADLEELATRISLAAVAAAQLAASNLPELENNVLKVARTTEELLRHARRMHDKYTREIEDLLIEDKNAREKHEAEPENVAYRKAVQSTTNRLGDKREGLDLMKRALVDPSVLDAELDKRRQRKIACKARNEALMLEDPVAAMILKEAKTKIANTSHETRHVVKDVKKGRI